MELMEVRTLNPNNIVPSTWAVRTDLSDTAFQALKCDIESNGGNVVPIKVRPSNHIEGQYQIVFGHRRHQACLELGLNVVAIVQSMNDLQLVEEMDRENRCRMDLSPYERGVLLANILDRGLFPSLRKMSETLDVNLGQASRLLSLARLPKLILSAFQQPCNIKESWARKIVDKLMCDPDQVLARAKDLAGATKKFTAAKIYSELTR